MDTDNEPEAIAALEAYLRTRNADLAEQVFEHCRTRRTEGTTYLEALANLAKQIEAGDATGVRAWVTMPAAGQALVARLRVELSQYLVDRFGGGRQLGPESKAEMFEAVVAFFKRHTRALYAAHVRPACLRYVTFGESFEIGAGRIVAELWARRAFPQQVAHLALGPAQTGDALAHRGPAGPLGEPLAKPKPSRRERRAAERRKAKAAKRPGARA